jgi:hypothetical protein
MIEKMVQTAKQTVKAIVLTLRICTDFGCAAGCIGASSRDWLNHMQQCSYFRIGALTEINGVRVNCHMYRIPIYIRARRRRSARRRND